MKKKKKERKKIVPNRATHRDLKVKDKQFEERETTRSTTRNKTGYWRVKGKCARKLLETQAIGRAWGSCLVTSEPSP